MKISSALFLVHAMLPLLPSPSCMAFQLLQPQQSHQDCSGTTRIHLLQRHLSTTTKIPHPTSRKVAPMMRTSFLFAAPEPSSEEQPTPPAGVLVDQDGQQERAPINIDEATTTTTLAATDAAAAAAAAEPISSNSPSDDGNDVVGGLFWRGVVVLLCAAWASNFAVIKLVLAEPGVDSSLFAVGRFFAAFLALAPFAVRSAQRAGMDAETLKGAATCGSWVAFGYIGQLLGLLTTTASKSCVICSLHCVLVAIIAEAMRVSKVASANFNTTRLVPALLAVIGVAIVELKGAAGPPTIGDFLSFAQPLGFGMGYLQLEELMSRRADLALPVSAIKLLMVALASFALFEFGPLMSSDVATSFALRLPDFGAILTSPIALGGVLYTGLITTALALWVESVAFARVPATDASIILTTEPLFAGLLAAITLGETFGMSDYFGATLIIGACVAATLMDTPGEEGCPADDPDCETPRKWPFWGF